MLMEKYGYVYSTDASGIHVIVLTEKETGKTVTFKIADKTVKAKHICQHMDSLTDELCSGWFNKKTNNKGKKKSKENAE